MRLHRRFERFAIDNVAGNIHTRLHRILQHHLAVSLEKWQHESTKETSQNAAETVSALEFTACEYGYLASILPRIIVFV